MFTKLRKNINREDIESLPSFLYEGEIIVIEDKKEADEIAGQLLYSPILGFDTETRPAFRKGEIYKVSLLQLCNNQKVYLFRLNKCGLTPVLRQILENPQITKVGVGIRDDLRHLQRLAPFTPASFVDLQNYAEKFGIEEKSFSKLMAIIFGVKISKRQRTSNWETSVLTEAQLRYAATDAWGALKMYTFLTENDKNRERKEM